ncbi:MAG: glycosyltransferase family 2 protein [Desulfuromonadaceae bacterium]
MNSLVAIIIVNYNGLDDTVECLNSLRLSTYQNIKIIVVDNASRKNPLPLLVHDFPEVCCIRSEINLGFTGGNNLGLAKVDEFDPKYIFYLNNDTVVTPDTLAKLVNFMEQHPDVGIAGPLVYCYDEPKIISFCGADIDRNTAKISFKFRNVTLDESILSDDAFYCSFIEGSSLMIRTELVKMIGGFNDDYFLTSEESELCIRVADMGCKLAVVTTCSILHKVSKSMGAGSELINYFVYRNKLYLIRNVAVKFGMKEFINVSSNYLRSLISLLIRERNIPAAKGLISGVIDFLLGVTGPGRFQTKLQ